VTLRINPSLTTKIDPSKTASLYRCFEPNGWSNYVDVTIDHTQVDSDVSDHTILIQDTAALGLFPSAFWSAVKADGSDIVVTDARSGRHLHQELEYIDITGGSEQLALHVLIPQLQNNKDFVLRIYYGNVSASIPSEKATWPTSKWAFVSHMADNVSGGISDSTHNGKDGTKVVVGTGSEPTEAAGLVGKAQLFSPVDPDNGGYIALPADTYAWGTNDLVLLTVGQTSNIISRPISTGNGNRVQFYGSESDSIVRLLAVNWDTINSTDDYYNGSYHYLTGQFDRDADMSINLDGNKQPDTYDISGDAANNISNNVWYIGARYDKRLFFDGLICEARIGRVALSEAEHKLIYLAYLDPSTLYGVSGQQSV